MLFGSATSKTIYFFCLLSNAFPDHDFGSVGSSLGIEKTPPQKMEMEKKSLTRKPSTSA